VLFTLPTFRQSGIYRWWAAGLLIGYWRARRATLLGGIIIACGHYSMAVNSKLTFFLGLILIACGTGLLKPNISAMVGQLYSEEDKRRDAGFSIFYMGINLGAFLSPIVVGFLAQSPWFRNFISSMGFDPNAAWHFGFAAAGVGMTLGLIQYLLGQKKLAAVGNKPEPSVLKESQPTVGVDYLTLGLAVFGGIVGAALGVYFGDAGILSALFPCVVGFFAGYLLGIIRHLNGDELRRVYVIFILFLFLDPLLDDVRTSRLQPDTFRRSTDSNHNTWLGVSFELVSIRAGNLRDYSGANHWRRLAKTWDRQPSSPGKFTIGLFFAGIAFVVIAFASTVARAGRVSPMWLVVVYFLQTIGELCLSPVGLSTVTKLSPARMVGLMMGVWFLSISIGSYIAGLTTRLFATNDTAVLTRAFGVFAGITLLAAVILVVLTPFIKRMTPKSV
jgi:POT family proton-dependent oligopeptide transporter